MKQKRKYTIFILILLCFLCVTLAKTTYAGFGDYNDYDSGSDWGDSDWGDSDWGDSDYYDSDYSSSGDGDWSDSGIAIVFTIICIVFIVLRNTNFSSHSKAVPANSNNKPLDKTTEIEALIQKIDPYYTANDFIAYIKRVYIDIQDAWCKRDLAPVRAVLHPNLYEQTQKQIEKKLADHIVNHLERLAVKDAYIAGYKRDKNYEYLYCYLTARMIDYQVNETTGQVIHGDKKTEWNLAYKMTFMRTNGFKTPENKDTEKSMICPSCGAPLSGTAFGKCEYCGSTVTTGQYGWVLSDFTLTKNTTFNEGIQILNKK